MGTRGSRCSGLLAGSLANVWVSIPDQAAESWRRRVCCQWPFVLAIWTATQFFKFLLNFLRVLRCVFVLRCVVFSCLLLKKIWSNFSCFWLLRCAVFVDFVRTFSWPLVAAMCCFFYVCWVYVFFVYVEVAVCQRISQSLRRFLASPIAVRYHP